MLDTAYDRRTSQPRWHTIRWDLNRQGAKADGMETLTIVFLLVATYQILLVAPWHAYVVPSMRALAVQERTLLKQKEQKKGAGAARDEQTLQIVRQQQTAIKGQFNWVVWFLYSRTYNATFIRSEVRVLMQ